MVRATQATQAWGSAWPGVGATGENIAFLSMFWGLDPELLRDPHPPCFVATIQNRGEYVTTASAP